ncbi:MAG: IS3 family transposase [Thermoflavifilum aggregans]|nr:IS3 family transposase [Thermoflavifilum aggregans]
MGRYRVSKTLSRYGLKAIQPRSFVPRTTDSRHTYQISHNLLLDRNKPQKPNEVWVGDLTYIPLSGGNWCYLSVFMDLYSRRIIGWELQDNIKEQLACRTLSKAIRSRKIPKGLIIHTDRGGQYGGHKFRSIIHEKKMLHSMSLADNPYDNAFMESCFSRFKAELLQDGIFETIEDAYTEIFKYIEMYYNTQRIHSSLGYQSPHEFEKQFEKNCILDLHKQGTMLYTEESPFIRRGIEPLPMKHKQEEPTLPKESALIL